MKTKLAFIVPYRFVPPQNGGHKAAYGLAKAVASQTKHFFVLSTTANPSHTQTPFPLFRALTEKKRKYFSPIQAQKISQFLQKKNTGACLLHQPFIGLLLYPVLRKQNIKLYIWVQNIEYERFRSMKKWFWPLVKWVEHFMYRKAEKLFFISPSDIPIAIRSFNLPSTQCVELPFPINRQTPATTTEVNDARARIIKRHNLNPKEHLLLFFGPQKYQPNREAVNYLIQHINPRLKKIAPFPYRILICGGGLQTLPQNLPKEITYLGFVPEIEEYILAAHLVLNPITSGGGVKIKVLEALALGKSVLSFEHGALGIRRELCGNKLQTVENKNYDAFCQKILQMRSQTELPTPKAFYKYHSEEQIFKTIKEYITEWRFK